MKIRIKRVNQENIADIGKCDGTFVIESKLLVKFEDGIFDYEIVPAPPAEKRYDEYDIETATYINNPEKIIFLAYIDDQIAGQITLRKNWNAYAYIEDIVVDVRFRKMGVGGKLIAAAKEWMAWKKLHGIMLETQNNNAGACKFYEKSGFVLGGCDQYLYQGLLMDTDEIALYWYYFNESLA